MGRPSPRLRRWSGVDHDPAEVAGRREQTGVFWRSQKPPASAMSICQDEAPVVVRWRGRHRSKRSSARRTHRSEDAQDRGGRERPNRQSACVVGSSRRLSSRARRRRSRADGFPAGLWAERTDTAAPLEEEPARTFDLTSLSPGRAGLRAREAVPSVGATVQRRCLLVPYLNPYGSCLWVSCVSWQC